MDLLLAWLILPAVLAVVTFGCGLLVDRVAGGWVPGALIASLGLALVIVIATLMVELRLTGAVIPAAAAVLAALGFLLGRRRLAALRRDRWLVLTAAAVFAVMAAPIVMSGEATFFFFLNDTAVQFALLDWVPEHGRTASGLDPSLFQATVEGYLESGYPLGAHLGLAAVRPLAGIDIPWSYQPYLAFVVTLGALAIYALLRPIASAPFSAFAAFIAIQPGLVYAYYLSGTIKELAMLWVLLTLIVLVWMAATRPLSLRAMIPLALLIAASLAILNLAAVPWIGLPLAWFALAMLWRNRGRNRRSALRVIGGLTLVVLALSVPALTMLDTFRTVTTGVLTNQAELGNLLGPISPWHLAGVWPSGDFRTSPGDSPALAFALMGVAAASIVLGGIWAVRARRGGPLLLFVTSGIAVSYLVWRGSPYADAKAMMIASSGMMVLALLGVVSFLTLGRRLEAVILAAALAGGVLWTNALAYQNAQVASRDRYSELESINQDFGDEGPALVAEYDPYLHYFLRQMQPSRPVLRSQAPPREGERAKFPYDLDDVSFAQVQEFPLIVIRRSPLNSRPPLNFELAWSGDHYEVWRQFPGAAEIREHLPLGDDATPASEPRCRDVRRLAARAERGGGRLAYVERPETAGLRPGDGVHPSSWATTPELDLVPRGEPGAIHGSLKVGTEGPHRVWLQAVIGRDIQVTIDGRHVGTVEGGIGQPGQMLVAGEIDLQPGEHDVRMDVAAPAWRPAQDGYPRDRISRLVLQPVEDALEVRTVAPDAAADLCGRRLDWVEAVG